MRSLTIKDLRDALQVMEQQLGDNATGVRLQVWAPGVGHRFVNAIGVGCTDMPLLNYNLVLMADLGSDDPALDFPPESELGCQLLVSAEPFDYNEHRRWTGV